MVRGEPGGEEDVGDDSDDMAEQYPQRGGSDGSTSDGGDCG